MKEIIDAIRLALLERASSPLLGSFTIAWSLWNYKALLILFSKLAINEKFRLLNQLYGVLVFYSLR